MAAPKPASPNQPTMSSSNDASATSSAEELSKENLKGFDKEQQPSSDDKTSAAHDNVPKKGTIQKESAVVTAETNDTAHRSHDENEPSLPMTYSNTKNSAHYLDAKKHLETGDFESALSTLETALNATRSLLADSNDELHESLAPLYYLYGTTLLYSVEESNDPEAQMMVQQNCEAGSTPAASDEAAPASDDLEIAWEMLETARSILDRIVTSTDFASAAAVASSNNDHSSSSASSTAESRGKILDLAQIHNRLGDLQRANGNYDEAIHDYIKCLEMRTEVLGPYDRKVADSHYSLGTAYMLCAAEGEKSSVPLPPAGSEGIDEAVAATTPAGRQQASMSKERLNECRNKSLQHYLSCGMAFGGLSATLCGADPTVVASVSTAVASPELADDDEDSDDEECANKGKGKGKCSPKTKSDKPPTLSTAKTASRHLAAIRSRVKSLVPQKSSNQAIVSDIKEMLDEIQETIDASEESVGGLRDVAAMKAKAEAAADEEDGKALSDGISASKGSTSGTTTIGFGAAASLSTTKCPTTTGFGTDTSLSSKPSAGSAPVMVVKKKKKRPSGEEAGSSPLDAKRAKAE